ncbi:hypothetical protein JCM8097_008601 [Rhodosporidiobolus ruineniae]
MHRSTTLPTALVRAARPPPATSFHRLINSPSSAATLASLRFQTRQKSHSALIAAWASRTATPDWNRRTFFSSSSSGSSSSSQQQHSSSSSSSPPPDPDAKLPLTQRIKALFRKHGWTALVLYLVLSALDFGATFLLISAVGADRVREAEDWTLDKLGWKRKEAGEPGRFKAAVDGWRARHAGGGGGSKEVPTGVSQKDLVGGGEAHEPVEASALTAQQKKDAAVADKGYSAYATTAVLAYAIHKTLLLPFRVGVTVAITPKVVRTLQGWGWKVGYAGTAAAAAPAAAAATKEASS